MVPSEQLLRQYAEAQCEQAFSELVQHHLNLVYSAALRQVAGNNELAADIVRDSSCAWIDYQTSAFPSATWERGQNRRIRRSRTGTLRLFLSYSSQRDEFHHTPETCVASEGRVRPRQVVPVALRQAA